MTSTDLPLSARPGSFDGSLNRNAMLAYAYHLYDRRGTMLPAMTSVPLASRQLNPANSEDVYKLQLLPLLVTMRTFYPQDLSILLLMACTHYALGDYEASLRISEDILALDPDFVRFFRQSRFVLLVISHIE